MEKNILTLSIDNYIARLTLNRPTTHNALNPELISALTVTLEKLATDTTVRVVILSGAGQHFCAGGDIDALRHSLSFTPEQNIDDAGRFAKLFYTLDTFPKPVIAAVQGAVYGGGVGLIAAADIVVAAESSRFCFSEVKLGLIPAMISPYVITAIGERQARRYFITAEAITAEKALELGLIHEVVPAANVVEKAHYFATTILQNAPIAVARTKHFIQAQRNCPRDLDLVHLTAATIAELRISPEGQEGLNAFLTKRPANWRV